MTAEVRTERDGAVLVVTIDNPPINAGSTNVRRGILDAVRLLAEDSALQAAVLIGAGSTFIAGSDLREFGRPLEEPQLPGVIAAIEACAKPVVAALHGAALGGGFELALGCDVRIAAAKTVLGLPEVTLGMIPGAGGTQRLPRLVGMARAIGMVCSGERVPAQQALALGIVDALADGDLRAAAVRCAAGLTGKRRLRDLTVPADPIGSSAQQAAQEWLRGGLARPNVVSAIEMVQAASSMPIDDALIRERALFQQFRMSGEAAALRHLFFAQREAAKDAVADQVQETWVQRLLLALRHQAECLREQGVPAERIDAAMQHFGLASQVVGAVADESVLRSQWLALTAQAARLAVESQLARAADLDVALVQRAAFPRWLGGPVFWARQQDPARLAGELMQLDQLADPSILLAR